MDNNSKIFFPLAIIIDLTPKAWSATRLRICVIIIICGVISQMSNINKKTSYFNKFKIIF